MKENYFKGFEEYRNIPVNLPLQIDVFLLKNLKDIIRISKVLNIRILPITKVIFMMINSII